MTHTPLTKAEREELRRLHADKEAADKAKCLTNNLDDYDKASLDSRVLTAKLWTASSDALPRLLADLDAAEAKIKAVTDVPDDIHDAIDELAESAYAWADSDTEPVSEQAAKERIADSRLRVMVKNLLAQRDRAEAERDALKAKLVALVEAADDVGGALRDIAADAHSVYLDNLDAAIDAARGGAS